MVTLWNAPDITPLTRRSPSGSPASDRSLCGQVTAEALLSIDCPVSHIYDHAMADSDTRDRIIEASRDLISDHGITRTTVDRIVATAGVSKGLVSYHFGGKRGLFEALSSSLTSARVAQWTEALDQRSAQTAIDRSWRTLEQELADGTFRVWRNLQIVSPDMTEQTVKNSLTLFVDALGLATDRMLRRSGLTPAVPTAEFGALLASLIEGLGTLAMGGVEEQSLEQAWAAGWLGVLALTR